MDKSMFETYVPTNSESGNEAMKGVISQASKNTRRKMVINGSCLLLRAIKKTICKTVVTHRVLRYYLQLSEIKIGRV